MLSLPTFHTLYQLLLGWTPRLSPTLLNVPDSLHPATELWLHLPSFPSCLKAAQDRPEELGCPYPDHAFVVPSYYGRPEYRLRPDSSPSPQSRTWGFASRGRQTDEGM